MSYTEFLMCCLLRDTNSMFNELPYDEMYAVAKQFAAKYEESEFNVDDKTEYQCILDYLESINIRNTNFYDLFN